MGKQLDLFADLRHGALGAQRGEALKAQNPEIEIWAVEPEHAAILSGGKVGTHLQMGIGDGLIPDNLNQEIYDDITVVTDEEALEMAFEAVTSAKEVKRHG